MTRETSEQKFVRSILPWAVAGCFFILYLVTLNHWVTMTSLPAFAKATGVDWRHPYSAPLQYILLRPFGFLPASVQPIALNIFSSVAAALTLALLARSVRLLPHNRTRDQRQREPDAMGVLSLPQAWLPPLVAALLCGLQLTFWEHATAVSGDMLDLLIFAYLGRCLLEYRVSKNEKWTSKLALVYGLSVTNNWAMINYFPLFLAGVIWVKGMGFLKPRFLLRMLGLGSAGLLLYLLLPALDAASANPSGSFFEMLKANLRFQKNMTWQNPYLRVPDWRFDLFRLSLTSLCPVILVCIRWPSFQGDISPASDRITTAMFRFVHIVFLVFTIWLFLDPPFSPRILGRHFPFLTFYYLAALAAGYLAGYVLLVFGREPQQTWQAFSKYFRPVAKILAISMWLVAAAIPVALVKKNWAVIHAVNGPELRRFAKSMVEALPEKDAVVLSDDTERLFLAKTFCQQTGRKNAHLMIETAALGSPQYHRELRSAYPQFEKEMLKPEKLTNAISVFVIMEFLHGLDRQNPLFYLHPSFGLFFEVFYPRPRGLVMELKPYQASEATPPKLTAAEIQENEKFWNEVKLRVVKSVSHFRKESRDMEWLGMNYSRALNGWGVELQRAGRLEEAADYFSSALTLNPENVVAMLNQKSNRRLRKAGDDDPEAMKEIDKKLNQYRSWQPVLSLNGPFDGFATCFTYGQKFLAEGHLRQALAHFLRTVEIVPEHHSARHAAIHIYMELGFLDQALEQVRIGRGQKGEKGPLPENLERAYLELEARVYTRKKDVPAVEKSLRSLHEQYPKDEHLVRLLMQFYMELGRYEDALRITEKQLTTDPSNASALLNQSAALMKLKQYDQAVAVLDRLLTVMPGSPAALLNRAVVNVQREKFDEAWRDYEAFIELKPPRVFAGYHGLGELAEKTGQKNAAVLNYLLYLKTAPPNTQEYKQVAARLQELQGGKPAGE